jgi:hypothetical protein
MGTFTILSTGSPIVPYQVKAISAINVSQSYQQIVGSSLEFESSEFNAQMEAAALNIENCYKTLPEFVQQDSTRNATYLLTPVGEYYSQVVNFTITSAIVSVLFNVTTDLTDGDLHNYLQEQADLTIVNFKSQWGWVDL